MRRVARLDAELSDNELRTRRVEQLNVAESDDRFDRITALACAFFGVPMASVTLLDSKIARFPGSTGLGQPEPLPSGSLFCERTVKLRRPLVIEDATADQHCADLPSVVHAPYLRFYAGAPIDDGDGVIVGTFDLFDIVPRRLDPNQLGMLVQLADWARRELVDSTEMARAREVQSSLLPRRIDVPDGWELASVCQPTRSVGGDFFDHAFACGRLYLTLMDVMGKGVGAGLVAASVQAMLRASLTHQVQSAHISSDETGLRDLLTTTDQLLGDDLGRSGTLVTGFAASIDPDTGELRWVDAGHGLAVIVRHDGSSERLVGTDLPIGINLGASWTEHHAHLSLGDTLMVVSDGLFDLLGGTDDAFEQIIHLVQVDPNPDHLIQRISQLTSVGTAMDDVTAVAVRRRPETP